MFGIEENPYYFKKYFLYYSEEELRLLEGHNFESVSAIVVDDIDVCRISRSATIAYII
ncbi:hypothetical protein AAC723_27755 (plasmid) [Klebsiella pneumoniae]